MKYLLLSTLISLALVGAPVAAGFEPSPSPAIITKAVDVYTAWDDVPCQLIGRILMKIPGRKHRYLFEDASGKVVVKIKPKVFGDFTVTPADLVQLDGEVEVDHKYPNEVDVHYLGIIGPASLFSQPLPPAP